MFRSRILSRVLWQQRFHLKPDYAGPISAIGVVARSRAVREHSTVAVDDSYVKKFMKAVGWMDQSRTRLKLTGYFLYESVPDKVAYLEWFQNLNLPDTFATWFTITELHVWLLLVRYMAEDVVPSQEEKKKYIKGDGSFVRNCIIEALWADVGNRIKFLEGANPAIARKQVSELSEQFQAALVGYDEGLSDDRLLAAAVWRRFYSMSEDTQVEHVERIVHFIRHQAAALARMMAKKSGTVASANMPSALQKRVQHKARHIIVLDPKHVERMLGVPIPQLLKVLDKIPSEDLKWKPDITWLSILKH